LIYSEGDEVEENCEARLIKIDVQV